jgi:hypothetical protein
MFQKVIALLILGRLVLSRVHGDAVNEVRIAFSGHFRLFRFYHLEQVNPGINTF